MRLQLTLVSCTCFLIADGSFAYSCFSQSDVEYAKAKLGIVSCVSEISTTSLKIYICWFPSSQTDVIGAGNFYQEYEPVYFNQ